MTLDEWHLLYWPHGGHVTVTDRSVFSSLSVIGYHVIFFYQFLQNNVMGAFESIFSANIFLLWFYCPLMRGTTTTFTRQVLVFSPHYYYYYYSRKSHLARKKNIKRQANFDCLRWQCLSHGISWIKTCYIVLSYLSSLVLSQRELF